MTIPLNYNWNLVWKEVRANYFASRYCCDIQAQYWPTKMPGESRWAPFGLRLLERPWNVKGPLNNEWLFFFCFRSSNTHSAFGPLLPYFPVQRSNPIHERWSAFSLRPILVSWGGKKISQNIKFTPTILNEYII